MNDSRSVRLRPIEQNDLAFLRDLANDTEVRAQVVGWDWLLSLAGQQAWFSSELTSNSTRRFIVETVSGDPLGMTGLWKVDWRNRTAMTALKLGGSDNARGQGYGRMQYARSWTLHSRMLASTAFTAKFSKRTLGHLLNMFASLGGTKKEDSGNTFGMEASISTSFRSAYYGQTMMDCGTCRIAYRVEDF